MIVRNRTTASPSPRRGGYRNELMARILALRFRAFIPAVDNKKGATFAAM